MTANEARQVLEGVTESVREIDMECSTLLSGVEHGLINVKLEFRDRAHREINKKLTEEQLIAWLVKGKLAKAGNHVEWESPYPANRRRKCDLVLRFADARLWLELNLASKAWFNCESKPTYVNGSYLPYLQGIHHTHSFRHDFEKLTAEGFAKGDFRAVCLIGFDHEESPMDGEVNAVVEDVRKAGIPWESATERHWPDRRCADFRVNVWTWLLPA